MASVIEMFIQDDGYLNEQLVNTPIKLQKEIKDYIGIQWKYPLTLHYLKNTPKKNKLNILTLFYRRSPDYINDPQDYDEIQENDIDEYANWYWAPLLKIWPKLDSIVNAKSISKKNLKWLDNSGITTIKILKFFNGFPPRQGGEGGFPSFERYSNFYDKYRRAVLKDFLDMYSPNTKWNLEKIFYIGSSTAIKEIEIYDVKLETLKEIMWMPYADYPNFLLYKLEEDAFPPIFWFKINTLKKRLFMNYWELPWDTVK